MARNLRKGDFVRVPDEDYWRGFSSPQRVLAVKTVRAGRYKRWVKTYLYGWVPEYVCKRVM